MAASNPFQHLKAIEATVAVGKDSEYYLTTLTERIGRFYDLAITSSQSVLTPDQLKMVMIHDVYSKHNVQEDRKLQITEFLKAMKVTPENYSDIKSRVIEMIGSPSDEGEQSLISIPSDELEDTAPPSTLEKRRNPFTQRRSSNF